MPGDALAAGAVVVYPVPTTPAPEVTEIQHYNLWLVALSLAVAVLASYTTLDIALRLRTASARSQRYWLLGGSIALGVGIWSMHFIGMLAHHAPVAVGYDPALTLLSVMPAVGAAALALRLLRHQSTSRGTIIGGGLLIGAGIVSMHYIGMAAMRMYPSLDYDPALVFLSCLIAVAAATAALAIGVDLRSGMASLLRKQLGAAVVLGLAISGMHYTGMAAAEFEPGLVSLAYKGGLHDDALAITAGLGSFAVLTVALLIATFDARLASEHAAARQRLELEVARRTEELARSNAELEHFAHIASHDLKEPLRTIANFAQLLERGGSLDDRQREYLRFITRSTSRMQHLIDELLTFAKLTQTSAPSEAVDVDALLDQVEASLAAAITDSGARILRGPLPSVQGWSGLLEHVFLNLLSNAIKFRAPDRSPRIHISAEADGEYWRFTVRDNGIGVAADGLGRMFEMFERLDGQQHPQGTGLGLAVVRKVVEHHGGRVEAESTPGEGTAFHFTLPRPSADRPGAQRRTPPTTASGGPFGLGPRAGA